MSGLTIFASTPTIFNIIIDLPIDATVEDLIAAAGVTLDHHLYLENQLYSSVDKTTLADLGICPEQRVELVLPRRKKLIAVVTTSSVEHFRIENIGVLFDLPKDITKEEGYRLMDITANEVSGRSPFPNIMFQARIAILPDHGVADPFLSDHPTTTTLFGLPIPEFVRKSFIRQCPVDEPDRYTWAKNWLPNINTQLRDSVRCEELVLDQPDGFVSPTTSIWENCPSIPQDYIIGNAPRPRNTIPIMSSEDEKPTRDLEVSMYDRRTYFFWRRPPTPPLGSILILPDDEVFIMSQAPPRPRRSRYLD